jgi:hypothetical protein
MSINFHVVKSTVVGALGGLLFGFDTAVISGTTNALTQTYHLSPAMLGVTVSSASSADWALGVRRFWALCISRK